MDIIFMFFTLNGLINRIVLVLDFICDQLYASSEFLKINLLK